MMFEQALRAAGLHPRDIVADGRWRRCPTDDKPRRRNGAYVLYPDGHGMWRNWATDPGLSQWRDNTATEPTPAQRARVEARMQAQRQRDRAQRLQGIKNANAIWQAGRPFKGHAYIEGKRLTATGCNGLRLWDGMCRGDDSNQVHDTWLLVPMFWRDRLVNVQRIGSTGLKRFVLHAPAKAAIYVIDRPRAAITAFVEGLATGLAVYQCMRHARVVVAFDAGNLLPVIQEMKPTGMVAIAGDNDHATKAKRGFNPGIDKATNAAELIGCGVAWPEGIDGSDWADYLMEHGPESARRIERLIQGAAKYVDGPS